MKLCVRQDINGTWWLFSPGSDRGAPFISHDSAMRGILRFKGKGTPPSFLPLPEEFR